MFKKAAGTARGLFGTFAVLRQVILLAFLVVGSSQVHGSVPEILDLEPQAHHHHSDSTAHHQHKVAETGHCHVTVATLDGLSFYNMNYCALPAVEHLVLKERMRSYPIEEPPTPIIDVS